MADGSGDHQTKYINTLWTKEELFDKNQKVCIMTGSNRRPVEVKHILVYNGSLLRSAFQALSQNC
jgi:hypothetical protein